MSLPDLIEIVPLKVSAGRVFANVTIPGSKSITNRALIAAALSHSSTTLQGALWSEDTQVMVECLTRLGFEVIVQEDFTEKSNRIISVKGMGGNIPRAGNREKPLELFVGNAGTSARFLSALVCLGNGYYRLHGVERMHERPQSDLFSALRQLGYDISTPNDKLPAIIHGTGPSGKSCEVSIVSSSQFASALILCAAAGRWEVKVIGENAEESPYVAMTSKLLESFPRDGGTFLVEPDSSSGSYFEAAGFMLGHHPSESKFEVAGGIPKTASNGVVRVNQWPQSDWQIDSAFPSFLPLPACVSRMAELGDSIMTAMIVAADAASSSASAARVNDIEFLEIMGAELDLRAILFKDLGRLRVQECERVEAMRTELAHCGAAVIEYKDNLVVTPSRLHGAEIETYNDHRMAMCFAILGLVVRGIKLRNPSCVKKTFPNFFQKLAAEPPYGLGAVILDERTRKPIGEEELFAH